MNRLPLYLLFVCAVFHGGIKGVLIRIVQEQVVAIHASDDGSAGTKISTMGGTFWVREAPEDVAAALAAATACK